MNRKVYDGVMGLAAGDALGVPVEFKWRDAFTVMGMMGYGTHYQPAGAWSDDTSMALATCDSIKTTGRIDVADIRKRFEAWLFKGEYTPYGRVFDCGGTTSDAIHEKQGLTGPRSNGNGSLMRIVPLAFVDCTDQEIADVSAITHGRKISTDACVIYVTFAKLLLEGIAPKDALAGALGRSEHKTFSRLPEI